jgi:hypothetical protein
MTHGPRQRVWLAADAYGGRWRITLPAVLARHPPTDRDAQVRWRLERLMSNAFDHGRAREDATAATLIEIYDALTGARIGDRLPDPRRPSRDPRGLLVGFQRDLRHELLAALRCDALRIEALPARARPFLDSPDAPASIAPVEPVRIETTYFALRVVDEAGAGVDGVTVVFNADGADLTMRTDPSGMARIDGVKAPNASVRLGSVAAVRAKLEPRWAQPRSRNVPQGDGVVVRTLRDDGSDFVALRSAALVTLVIVPATWIEICLIGEDGQPIPGEAYRVTFPDGSFREGRLDASGLSRVDGIGPGTCLVTFPDLDEEAWAPKSAAAHAQGVA